MEIESPPPDETPIIRSRWRALRFAAAWSLGVGFIGLTLTIGVVSVLNQTRCSDNSCLIASSIGLSLMLRSMILVARKRYGIEMTAAKSGDEGTAEQFFEDDGKEPGWPMSIKIILFLGAVAIGAIELIHFFS